ncbi:MAG: GTP-binding protein [Candidatus Heimdallarchaeota archaeon]|nr:GTP-binding protein [Candidatus Heimdallarchaeota archaeon]
MSSPKTKRTRKYITQQTLERILPLEKQKDLIIKVAIAGIGGVGKTTLCQRAMGHILDDYFNNYKITIGVQFFTHTVKTDMGNVVMSVWDLAGQPQFQQIMDRFLKGSKGIILAFDSTVLESFFSLYHTWIPLIKENCEKDIPILLVSTKNDLNENIQVKQELVSSFINDVDLELNIIDFLETSSKSNINVKETFEVLCKNIIKNNNSKEQKNVQPDIPSSS